jgi:hypothetical protein
MLKVILLTTSKMRTEMNMHHILQQAEKIMKKVHSTVKEGPAHAEEKVNINLLQAVSMRKEPVTSSSHTDAHEYEI